MRPRPPGGLSLAEAMNLALDTALNQGTLNMTLARMHEVIARIMAELFTAEERRLAQTRHQLVKANAEYHKDKPHDGFLYQGKPYDLANLERGARTRVSLHFNMIEQMEAYLADQEQVLGDRYYIGQMLATVLRPCSDWQDIRDALPNCLMDTVEELRSYQRSRSEAYTIQTDTRTVRQYQKVLPRIEFYATSRLLY